MLVHLMGLSRALEMMLSGELMGADEAKEVGLVSRVVPQEKLMEEAREVASKLTEAAPLAQQAIKRSAYRALFDLSTLDEFMAPLLQVLFQTEDHLEGAKAFIEKREPVYKGR